MNMKFKDKYVINPEFEDLFEFDSEQEELEYEAKCIMFRFLSAFESVLGKPLKKKEIAGIIEKTPSYITQLFRGDKIINLLTLAKIEKEFNIVFTIQAQKKNADYGVATKKIAKRTLRNKSTSSAGTTL